MSRTPVKLGLFSHSFGRLLPCAVHDTLLYLMNCLLFSDKLEPVLPSLGHFRTTRTKLVRYGVSWNKPQTLVDLPTFVLLLCILFSKFLLFYIIRPLVGPFRVFHLVAWRLEDASVIRLWVFSAFKSEYFWGYHVSYTVSSSFTFDCCLGYWIRHICYWSRAPWRQLLSFCRQLWWIQFQNVLSTFLSRMFRYFSVSELFAFPRIQSCLTVLVSLFAPSGGSILLVPSLKQYIANGWHLVHHNDFNSYFFMKVCFQLFGLVNPFILLGNHLTRPDAAQSEEWIISSYLRDEFSLNYLNMSIWTLSRGTSDACQWPKYPIFSDVLMALILEFLIILDNFYSSFKNQFPRSCDCGFRLYCDLRFLFTVWWQSCMTFTMYRWFKIEFMKPPT